MMPKETSKKCSPKLFLTFLTTLLYSADTATDLILVASYFRTGHPAWAASTLVMMVVPFVIVNAISYRWRMSDSQPIIFTKLIHVFGLGIFHRYGEVMKLLTRTRENDEKKISWLNHLQSDVCILRLFESFLESAPQLVLQLYVMAELDDWNPWTATSVATSLLSLAWGVTSYAKTQRAARSDKAELSVSGIVFQSVWRFGTIGARIVSLVLATRILNEWILVILLCHFCCMTTWIKIEETDFCETKWEEFIYNCIVGCIYCFDFFNIAEGQSRYKMAVFYCVIVCENVVFVGIYVIFGDRTERLYFLAPALVTAGMVLGILSLFLYYLRFHPSGKIRLFKTKEQSMESILTAKSAQNVYEKSEAPVRRTLKNHRSQKSLRSSPCRETINLEAAVDLSLEVKEPDRETVVTVEQQAPTDTQADIIPPPAQELSQQYHLKVPTLTQKLLEDNISEILSTHDYENIAAINICRNLWGVRHWNTYTDIQTRNHDYSIARDRDYLDSTLTSYTTSKDYMDLTGSSRPGIFASQCESLPELFNTSVIQNDYCDFGTLSDLWRSSTMENIYLAEDGARVIAFSEEAGYETGSYMRGCLSPRSEDYENVWDKPVPKRGQLHDFYARLPSALETILEENDESLISNQSLIKRCAEMRRSRASQAHIKRLTTDKFSYERHSPPKRPESAQSNHSTASGGSSLVVTVEEIVHSDVCDLYHAETVIPPSVNSSPEDLKLKAKSVLQKMHRVPLATSQPMEKPHVFPAELSRLPVKATTIITQIPKASPTGVACSQTIQTHRTLVEPDGSSAEPSSQIARTGGIMRSPSLVESSAFSAQFVKAPLKTSPNRTGQLLEHCPGSRFSQPDRAGIGQKANKVSPRSAAGPFSSASNAFRKTSSSDSISLIPAFQNKPVSTPSVPFIPSNQAADARREQDTSGGNSASRISSSNIAVSAGNLPNPGVTSVGKVPLTYEEVSFLSKLAVEQENTAPSFSSTPSRSRTVRHFNSIPESPISSPNLSENSNRKPEKSSGVARSRKPLQVLNESYQSASFLSPPMRVVSLDETPPILPRVPRAHSKATLSPRSHIFSKNEYF